MLIFGGTILVISVLGLYALEEECSDNTQCSSQNAVCLDSKCQCGNLSYSASNNSLCLTYVTEYKSICYEDKQCEWIGNNSGCTNNECICNTGYRWYQGKCQTYSSKGGECNTSDDCYDGYNMLALTCKSNSCVCNSGYYDRGEDCRVSSTLKGECAINDDCKPLLFISTVCELGKCEFPTTSEEAVTSSSAESKNSRYKITTNINLLGMQKRPVYQKSRVGSVVLESLNASSKETCLKLNNTMWFKETTCICQQGFFLLNGICIAELGMADPHVNYTADKDCPIKPGKLQNNICYCKNYWFYDDTNRECIKTTLEKTKSCMTNEWCRAMGPYAFCNSATGQCQCNSFATLDNSTFYCNKNDDVPISVCLKDTECPIGERCLNEQCECEENFSRSTDGTCLPDIGGSCSFRSCSHISNSSCSADNICTCNDNYVASSSECYEVAASLNEVCEIDQQCSNLKNSACDVSPTDRISNSTRKTCICDTSYTEIDGTCYQKRNYGDICSTREDCTLVINESFQCRKNICQCPVKYNLIDGYCSSATLATSLSLLTALFSLLILSM